MVRNISGKGISLAWETYVNQINGAIKMTQENVSIKRDISTGGNFITTWNELDSSRLIPKSSELLPINIGVNVLIRVA